MGKPKKEPKIKRKTYIDTWRFLFQIGAFIAILINPFLNYYFHVKVIQGWYQSIAFGHLWFVSPLEGIEALLITKIIYMPWIIGMMLPIIVALLLGRVFCSWICPINFFYEIMDRIHKKVSKRSYYKRKPLFTLPRWILWVALVGELLLAMIVGKPFFVFLSPPGLVGREIMMAVFFHTLALEGIVILIVLTTYVISQRFFCQYFCPLGALLAFIGSKRRLIVIQNMDTCRQCGFCDRACPWGIYPSRGEAESIYCTNCGSCVAACPFNARKFVFVGFTPSSEKLRLEKLPSGYH